MDYLTAPIPIARNSVERNRDHARFEPTQSVRERNLPRTTSSSTTNRSGPVAPSPNHAGEADVEGAASSPPASPASPELISSLITSLSVISRPASRHFDSPLGLFFDLPPDRFPGRSSVSPSSSSSSSPSPSAVSMSVEHGAFAKRGINHSPSDDGALNLAAASPVIWTSKPSGSPKPPNSPHEKAALRRLISRGSLHSAANSSRPASRASFVSATESMGNVTVERGNQVKVYSEGPYLKPKRSYESWGRMSNQSQRGQTYTISKEVLREKEEWKRTVAGNSRNASPARILSSNAASPIDPWLAESIINEEPAFDCPLSFEQPSSPEPVPSSRLIPPRDSSLRKTGAGARRLSWRNPRASQRDSEKGMSKTILEVDEAGKSVPCRTDAARRRHNSKEDIALELSYSNVAVHRRSITSSSFSTPRPDWYKEAGSTSRGSTGLLEPTSLDEGAPSPNIYQSRRRDRESSTDRRSKRLSGRTTPDLLGGHSGYNSGHESNGPATKAKRSSSRMKRMSAVPNQAADDMANRSSAAGTTLTDQPHIAYERPESADSIDESVEKYLCSARLSQTIRHAQTGRVISFSEVGDPTGNAVFCCVGMGLTRYITAFYDELAVTLKLRLITPDRPGVGDSESYADGNATPLQWPDDVYAICQFLKITKFSILAHSAGAIYALATALRMPQHIRGRIHLLAPWIPPSQMSVFGASAQTPLPPTNAIPTSQRILRALPTPILKAANSSFMSATSSSITSSLPKHKKTKRDKRPSGIIATAAAAKEIGKQEAKYGNMLAENRNGDGSMYKELLPSAFDMDVNIPQASPTPTTVVAGVRGIGHQARHAQTDDAVRRQEKEEQEMLAILASERQATYDNRLTHAIWQLATTGANPAVDLLVCLERRHTIGFRYVDITRPVVIHHGSRDTRVPVDNVRWLGKTMRRCEVRVLEGEGHGLMASAQVMGNVLMEVSSEWEEWGRATGQGCPIVREQTKKEGERSRRNTIGQAK